MQLRQRHGLSLIEVVAATALLSVLMVSILQTWTRHQRQLQKAQQKLEAADLLDEQLGQWFVKHGGPPFPEAGQLANSRMSWRTYRSASRARLPGNLIAVTIDVLNDRNEQILSLEVARSPGSRR